MGLFKPIGSFSGQPSSNAGTPLGREIENLARDLGLHPVTSPVVQKAMHHFVNTLHPTVGSGGVLIFELVATISRAVLDNSIARYGQVNPEDDAVACAGSPTRLLAYYRTKIPNGNFHRGVTIEGEERPPHPDAFWNSKNEEFENHHLVKRRFLTDSTLTVLAVMKAIPARLLAGMSDEQVRITADEIAASLTAQGVPVNLLSQSELGLLVAEMKAGHSAASPA